MHHRVEWNDQGRAKQRELCSTDLLPQRATENGMLDFRSLQKRCNAPVLPHWRQIL